jgi:hypothetical protein
MILAVIGVALAGYNSIKEERISMPKGIIIPACIAVIFSIICLISIDINHSDDYSYASYIVSFFVWLGGAYAVCMTIKRVHGVVDFKLLTYYLAGMSFSMYIGTND